MLRAMVWRAKCAEAAGLRTTFRRIELALRGHQPQAKKIGHVSRELCAHQPSRTLFGLVGHE
jgi:hypothetical protein